MRYRTYSYLLDAASWTGCTTELLDGGAALIRHPDFTLWVSIPFLDAEEGGAARLMSGRLSPQMAEALGIEVPAEPWWKRLLHRLGVAPA